MSKYKTIDVWNRVFGAKQEAYFHPPMLCYNHGSHHRRNPYHPTLDHIRPLSAGGCDVLENIIICHRDTNEEKADHFPHWKANGTHYHARRAKGSRVEYEIIED